jgi:alkylation response protein AidB-like acyl-CoA dehydrogenase
MEFALTDEQVMLQDTIVRTLDRVCPLDRVRACAAANESYAPDVWAALTELGLAGLIIPEEHGGSGLTLLDAALASESLGRSVAPVPFVSSAVMAPLALMGSGSPAQQAHWLPKLAAGEAIAGVAVSEQASGARDGAGVVSGGGRLTGKALFVLDAGPADLLIVADNIDGLHLVQGGANGLARTFLTSIDATRSIGELTFSDTPAEPLNDRDGAATLRRMIDAGRVVLAADMLGVGQRMIEKSVAYALERTQFGRVIGSFQAVKHLCAEMAAELEPCRSLIWYAAYAAAEDPERSSLMAAHAKAHTSEVGTFIARTATEVHGGMGFTDLMGLHYWFKRVGLDRQLLGGPERVRRDAALFQGWAR